MVSSAARCWLEMDLCHLLRVKIGSEFFRLRRKNSQVSWPEVDIWGAVSVWERSTQRALRSGVGCLSDQSWLLIGKRHLLVLCSPHDESSALCREAVVLLSCLTVNTALIYDALIKQTLKPFSSRSVSFSVQSTLKVLHSVSHPHGVSPPAFSVPPP